MMANTAINWSRCEAVTVKDAIMLLLRATWCLGRVPWYLYTLDWERYLYSRLGARTGFRRLTPDLRHSVWDFSDLIVVSGIYET